MSQVEYQVDTFTPNAKEKEYKKDNSKFWLDFDEPIIAPVQGSRGSGKGGLMDYMAQKYYDEQFTILHIWSARSAENLYWIVNKNCKLHFSKIKQLLQNKFYTDETKRSMRLLPSEEEKYMSLAERGRFVERSNNKIKLTRNGLDLIKNRLLHCNCDKAIPILLVVPDYIEFNQKTVDRLNRCYWKDMEEYRQNMSEITKEDKELLLQGKLLKPSYLRPKPLIKIKKITVPTSAQRKEKFHSEWTEAVLQARAEHRPLVMTPIMFEGMDKFETLGEVFKFHIELVNKSGHFKPLTEKDVGKPYRYWSKRQKNWHKIVILMNEARSVTPSSKMHGETGAGKSKRSVYDLVPEMRHMKTWYHTDFQNPSDIYDGIRPQSSFVILKRTSINLAGMDFKWFFEKIENDRYGLMRKLTKGRCDDLKYLKYWEMKRPDYKKYIDSRRPRISELPSNKAYIIYENNDFRLITNEMGRFHHKLSLEDAMLDTGLEWTVNREIKPEPREDKSKKEVKEEQKNRKKMKQTVFNKMRYLKEVEKKGWPDILKDLIQMEADGVVYGFDFHSKDNKWCSDKFRSWKKSLETIPN